MPATLLRRFVIALGVGVTAVVVVVAGLILGFVFHFHHFATGASFPAPRSALEAQRQDLDYFAKMISFDGMQYRHDIGRKAISA